MRPGGHAQSVLSPSLFVHHLTPRNSHSLARSLSVHVCSRAPPPSANPQPSTCLLPPPHSRETAQANCSVSECRVRLLWQRKTLFSDPFQIYHPESHGLRTAGLELTQNHLTINNNNNNTMRNPPILMLPIPISKTTTTNNETTTTNN